MVAVATLQMVPRAVHRFVQFDSFRWRYAISGTNTVQKYTLSGFAQY